MKWQFPALNCNKVISSAGNDKWNVPRDVENTCDNQTTFTSLRKAI